MPFNVGPIELVIVLVIALLVIGPRRLPEMGNAVGKTIREFRKASTEMTDAATLEPEAKPTAPAAAPATAPEPAAAAPAAPSVEATAAAPAAPAEPAAAAPAEPVAGAPAAPAAEPKSDDA